MDNDKDHKEETVEVEDAERSVSAKRRSKKRTETYGKYIRGTLNGIDAQSSMTKESVAIMNSILEDVFQRLAAESGKVATHASRQTITDREIESACMSVIRGHLGVEASMDGRKAVAKYRASLLAAETT